MVTSTLIIILCRCVKILLYCFRVARQEIIINSNELQDVMLRYVMHTLNANEAPISNKRLDVEKMFCQQKSQILVLQLGDQGHAILMK